MKQFSPLTLVLTAAMTFSSATASAQASESISLEAGSHTVMVDRAIHFYDDGGPDGKIASVIGNDVQSTYTFVPSIKNHAVTVNTASTFTIGNGRMMVYSGHSADSDSILGTVTGYSTTTGPVNLVSKAADGAVTIAVTTPRTAKTLDGFDLELGLHEKEPYTLTGLSISTPAAIMRGAKATPVATIAVTIKGDNRPGVIDKIVLDLAGSTSVADITGAQLCFSGSVPVYNQSTSTLVTSATPVDGKIAFESNHAPGDNGTFYYHVIADIDASAKAGNTLSMTPSVTFNAVPCDIAVTAATTTVKSGASGTLTVGYSDEARFASIAEAVDVISGGIEGPVTIELEEGYYTDCITLSSIEGASASSPITIRSKTGNRDDVIIMPLADAGQTDAFSIIDTPWVTISDLTIDATEGEFDNIISISDRSHHFTLSNCIVKSPTLTSGSSGTSLFRSRDTNQAGHNCDDITLTGNQFEGGMIAVYVSGTGMVALPKQTGATIARNTIVNPCNKGIYVSSVNDAVINDNIITQATTTRSSYSAIDIYRSTGFNAVRNKIVNTHSNYSTGIYVRDGSNGTADCHALVANNDIVITAQRQYGYGIQHAASSNVDYLFNTVRSAVDTKTPGGYLMGITGTGNTGITLHGNLLHFDIDRDAPKAFALYIADQNTLGSVSIKENSLWATNGNIAKIDATAITSIDDFNAAAQLMTGNISARASFLAETNQHLTEPGDLNFVSWNPLAPTDRDNVARNHTAATAGAYEYVDLTAEKPVIAEGFPIVTETGETTAGVKTRWNVAGKLYAMVETAGTPAPSAITLLSKTPVEIDADVETTTTFCDLLPSTDYVAYFFVVSHLNTESDVIASQAFTTKRHIDPLEVVTSPSTTIKAGEKATLTALVAGGDEPYTYAWRDQLGNSIGSTAEIEIEPTVTSAYYVTVTSADGQTVDMRTSVLVNGDFVPATFEDNYIADESSLAPTEDGSPLFSGSLAFNGMTMNYGGFSYWNGYSMSTETSTDFTILDDQYRSAAGGGHNSRAFAVAFPQAYTIDVTSNPEGVTLPGMFVTNAAYTFTSMKNGDAYSRKFEKGDYYMITVTGTDAGGATTGSIDFYLADLRSDNEADHYLLDTWEWLDLRPLGNVTSLSFILDSSDKGQWGMNTPGYFCIDDLGTDRDMTSTEITVEHDAVIDLAALFGNHLEGVTERYAIEPVGDSQVNLAVDQSTATATITDAPDQEMTTSFIVSLAAKGHTDYTLVNLTKLANKSGIESVGVDTSAPAAIEIYSVGGVLVKTLSPAANPRLELTPGIYVTHTVAADGSTISTDRIIIK